MGFWSDHLFRKPLLYPAELRGRGGGYSIRCPGRLPFLGRRRRRDAGKLPARFPGRVRRPIHGPESVRCRVQKAFSPRLWTPECNAFVQKPVQNHVAHRTSGAGVRRRLNCFFGSRWSSLKTWSGPCQGVALSEEPLGHAGGSPGGTDAFNPAAPSVAEGPSLYR